ncbi:MAG: DegV family protein [Lachnospiraceae bacterium]|nr:DegV family protein [Lachnospiraceae bacterium]MDD7025380.1 DegV family protein [Oscillospiraceae bacterium]
MGRIAIVTDSNSGITQAQAAEYGITVLPMPFYINEELYFEEINLTQEEFYTKLEEGAEISTSQPAAGDVLELWDSLLKEYEEIVYIPMSSGLSGSCETAVMLSKDYDGRVQVVNNQRISVTQRQSVMDAKQLAENGWTAERIREYLEKTRFDSSIYIMVDTLKYLKKGGRITPAAAALGTLLKLKPVLQIQGEKLDAFSKARTLKQAKTTMLHAIQADFRDRFKAREDASDMWIQMAYTGVDKTEIDEFYREVKEAYPNHEIVVNPLSLSVSCHIGPGALAITCTKKLEL